MSETMKHGQSLDKALRKGVTFHDGTPEGKYESFRATQRVNERFREDPLYIGATPFGSTQLGYANSSSDIDVAVLEDVSRAKYHADKKEFEKNVRKCAQGLNFSKHTELLFVEIYPHTIEEGIKISLERPWKPYRMGTWYLLFHPMAIGPRIDEFRARAADEIKKLPQSEQNAAIRSLARTAVFYESLRVGKINERVPGVDAYDLLEPYPRNKGNDTPGGEPEDNARIAVWRNQIRGAIGLQEK